jgi:DNA-directed RNA polymerase subunit RPC12/RpoP
MKKSELKQLIKEVIVDDNAPKQFIAFKGHDAGWDYYQLNLNPKYPNFYVNVNDSGKTTGFDMEDVKKYSGRFIMGDSLEDVQRQASQTEHKRKYGSGTYGDVDCPKCGYKYSINPIDSEYGYITSDYKTQIKCICGSKLFISIEDVNIKYNVKVG